MQADIRVRRVYDEPSPGDGTRVLVDRVWPRGLGKAEAQLDEWARDVAPSTELRKWYGHEPARFEEFRRRYTAELDQPEPSATLVRLRSAAADGPLTLLTATKDVRHSQAAVLADLLNAPGNPSQASPAPGDVLTEQLDEAECLRLIATAEVGRLAYSGRYGPIVLPVNYRLLEGTIVFRTGPWSWVDEDLRTGIEGAEFKVAFETDSIDVARQEGWNVLVQGSAHHVDSDAERAEVSRAVVRWTGSERERFLRIVPISIGGLRVHRR